MSLNIREEEVIDLHSDEEIYNEAAEFIFFKEGIEREPTELDLESAHERLMEQIIHMGNM